MNIKYCNVQSSKISEEKAIASLRSHLKYLQYRQCNWRRQRENDLGFFSNTLHHVDHHYVQQDIADKHIGNIYYHRILLSSDDNELVNDGDWQSWTRAIMHDLENRFGQDLKWYAIYHDADKPHVHIILQGAGKNRETGDVRPVQINRQDVAYVCERGRAHSGYENQQFLVEKLRELDQCDTVSKEG